METIAVEHGHRNSGISHKKVIFHGYVCLPNGSFSGETAIFETSNIDFAKQNLSDELSTVYPVLT